MLFNGVDINPGDLVEVTYRARVIDIDTYDYNGNVHVNLGPNADDGYENDYYDSNDLAEFYPDGFNIEVVERAFPRWPSSVIYSDRTDVFLTKNSAGDWIDLDSNVIYAEVDLGSIDDYTVAYNAPEYL